MRTSLRALVTTIVFAIGGIGLASAQSTFVRILDDDFLPIPATQTEVVPVSLFGPQACCNPAPTFDIALRAAHGASVPGGGTLSPFAPANPAIINDHGRIAFMAYVDGALRNQGIFVADPNGITPIAMGCGQYGGGGSTGTCGDVSPIGGHFSGMFGGTVFAPAINNNGDVLFISDVFGGSAIRGLFLYRAATGTIIKIAAPGDASPVGSTLAAVGPGSINNNGEIVFLGMQSITARVNILRWSNSVLSKVVAVGDAAPGGGTFKIIAGESFGFSDGTTIPIGAVPGINDAGQVCFFSTIQSGTYERGLFVSTGGVHQVFVKAGDATPLGGTYNSFYAPMINNAGTIAFFGDVSLPGGQFTSGLFVGTPGNYRKALAFYDVIGGLPVFGLAVTRNPIQQLDDCGNLLAWCAVQIASEQYRDTLLLCPASGATPLIIAQQGQPTPIGGTYGEMNAWMTLNRSGGGVLSPYTPGASGGVLNAHFVYTSHPNGDLTGDGLIDLNDLAKLLSNYGRSGFPGYSQGDLNGDGVIDLDDLADLLALYGADCRT